MVAHVPQQRVHRGAAGLVGQPERAGGGGGHSVRVGDRRQVDVAHAVGQHVCQSSRDLQGQPGLADAAGAGQRDEPVVRDDR